MMRSFLKICCLLSAGILVSATFARPALSFPQNTTSFMMDAESGKIISTDRADEMMYPASLTKVMTLYITFTAIENGSLSFDDMLKVSKTAASRSPSKIGVQAGSMISVRDAVMALIVKSANDCATVLAENIGFSEENFAKTMTAVAKELGMKNTVFKNASGLPNKEQKTTARDMAILAAAMYHHFPQYYEWFSAKSFEYKGTTYYSHNDVLKTFEGADGMKTGFTNAAGFNIITSAHRDGKRVIAVTMGHKTAKERDKKVSVLMDNGLSKLIKQQQIITANNSLPKEKNFAVQLGAFSNYAKARRYAVDISQQFSDIAEKNIEIEAVSKEDVVIYRSKIVGFAQDEAEKTCNDLKKSNKSCIVVANANKHIILAQK